jgi:AcrR family transcriptional regulator
MSSSVGRSLRERQAEEVRGSLRAAFVALVLERGGVGFSLHEVAEAAGVSDRTLYRHYPSRDELIEAIAAEGAAEMESARAAFRDDERLHRDPEWVADAFELFEQHADLMTALRMLRASGTEMSAATRRTKQVRDVLASSVGVNSRALSQLTALVRLVSGADGWARMRQPDLGLEPREAGYAAQWAIQVLIEAAREADGPLRPTTEEG